MRNAPRTEPSEDGYSIFGVAPADIERFPDDVRLMFWGWVVDVGLSQKDKDLAKGIDKDGHPMKAILPYTKKHRRSAMTPSGKGAPDAPPLSPGYQKSRVRSLLTGKAFGDHAEFWWQFDPYTHDSFARILEYQAENGRDVFGLSPAALRRTRLLCLERYDDWKKGRARKPRKDLEEKKEPAPKTDEEKLDRMEPTDSIEGESEFRTAEEWERYFRETAQANIKGRPRKVKSPHPDVGPDYNKMLREMWKELGKGK